MYIVAIHDFKKQSIQSNMFGIKIQIINTEYIVGQDPQTKTWGIISGPKHISEFKYNIHM